MWRCDIALAALLLVYGQDKARPVLLIGRLPGYDDSQLQRWLKRHSSSSG